MVLYHGSNMPVAHPRIIMPNRFLDFGPGFYTTANREQAVSFAGKVTARKKVGTATVTVYEFDENAAAGLNILGFSAADARWLDFVSTNRNGITAGNAYDMIYGPVADDDIYRTFILYSSGILSREQTLEALKIKKLFNQYVFATEKALEALKFIKIQETD